MEPLVWSRFYQSAPSWRGPGGRARCARGMLGCARRRSAVERSGTPSKEAHRMPRHPSTLPSLTRAPSATAAGVALAFAAALLLTAAGAATTGARDQTLTEGKEATERRNNAYESNDLKADGECQ